jgi:tetratricopeptide (TPR) repeat protein
MAKCVILIVGLMMPELAAADWIEVRTANFRFVGDAGERDIREIARKLEQFREALRHAAPELPRASPVPTIVVVFSGMRAFGPYQPLRDGRRVSAVAGFFQAADTVNYIAMTADGGPAAVRLVFHEYTHFLTANGLGETPAWFAEGLAQLYETTEVRDDGRAAIVGTPLLEHLSLLSGRAMMPIDRLMAVADTVSVLHADTGSSVFYAQSWALMHYLMLGNPVRTGQLRAYVAGLRRGDTPEAAFQTAFGADARQIEQEVARYVRQMQFAGRIYPLDAGVSGGEIPRGRPMATAEAEAYLADLLARTGREGEARMRLRALLDSDPDHARAAAALGWLELRASRLDVALPLLERAAALAPDDAPIVGAFGMALYEQARRDSSDRAALDAALSRSRDVLARAVALDGDAAPTLAALADVEAATGGDLERAHDLIDKAVALAPARLAYRLSLAEALLRLGDPDGAREHLESLAARSPNLSTTRAARELLHRITGVAPITAGAPFPSATRPALRLVREGERRVTGRFVRMDCGGPIVQFHVQTETGLLRLEEVLGGVQVIAYRPAPGSWGCGAVADAPRVLATYRPVASGTPGSDASVRPVDGVIVSMEIVPEGFVP